MSSLIDISRASRLLSESDDILILMHKNPDGDTLGCGFALEEALLLLGKRARAVCSSTVPSRYDYISASSAPEFEPLFIVSVDVAGEQLLGEPYESLPVDLAIDHHGTNSGFAKELYVDASSASCCEIIADVIHLLGVEWNERIAGALYTGVSTDTGCFRYSNTTAKSHELAARIYASGLCDTPQLNKLLFETKSRARVALEQSAISGMEFALDGRIAIITISLEALHKANCEPCDVEGVTSIPRAIEGVEAGITLRELENGNFKVSLRTNNRVDASRICAMFGGGGHIRAAGFECSGTPFDIKVALVDAIGRVLGS